MNQGKTAVIYARYSSAMQRDTSIEQQVSACMKFAERQELTVLRVYDDHAMTGTNDSRPQFLQMIKDSASRTFEYIIVYTLDRFSRNRYDSAIHKHALKENGVRVLSAMENISDDPTGILMESVLEGFAEYYSKELAQKVRRGLMSNAEKCIVNTAPPFGYKRGMDGKYEVVPAEAAIVSEIYKRVLDGEAMASIYTSLNERGIHTKRGNEWTKNSFSKLLHNELYIGVYRYADIRVEDGAPAIIDKTTFWQVQNMCQTKPNPQNSPKRRRTENGTYLLTGKVYCGYCNEPMIGVSGTGKHGEPHYYYICKTRRHHGPCHKSIVTRDAAEKTVASEIKNVIARPEVCVWLADKVIDYLNSQQETEEIKLLREQLTTTQREKENTLKAIRQGGAPACVMQMLSDLEASESSIAARLEVAVQRQKNDLDCADVISFLEAYSQGDINDKHYQEQLFDAFLLRVYLYDDHVKIVFNVTGNNEVEIPFGPEDVPDDVGTDEVGSYNAFCAPPQHAYTNPTQIYMIAGIFVLVAKIAG